MDNHFKINLYLKIWIRGRYENKGHKLEGYIIPKRGE